MPLPPPAYTEKNLSFLEFAVPAQGLVFIFLFIYSRNDIYKYSTIPMYKPNHFYKLFSKYLS
jgi:hypothetical protein